MRHVTLGVLSQETNHAMCGVSQYESRGGCRITGDMSRWVYYHRRRITLCVAYQKRPVTLSVLSQETNHAVWRIEEMNHAVCGVSQETNHAVCDVS